MHPAFASFLERLEKVPLDSATCRSEMKIIKEMSESYLGK
jgi:hypothetical protein